MSYLNLIREIMKEKEVSAYMVLSDDFHNSEYVGEYFKLRAHLSGFTGSAGTLVVMENNAGLWTDGRYFVQAEKQLSGSGIDLYKSGMPGVPTVENFLADNLKAGDKILVDGRTLNYEQGKNMAERLAKKDISLVYDLDISDKLWNDRPAMPKEKIYLLDECYAGKSYEDKLKAVREKMKENDSDIWVLASLDDICWLLNIRGNDVKYNPVALSYMIITMNEATLYIANEAVTDEVRGKLSGVSIKEYMSIYEDIKCIEPSNCIMFDGKRTNYTIGKILSAYTNCKCVDNPTLLMKAIKNPVEVENIKKAHILDGIALTRFMYYIKKNQNNLAENEYELGELIAKLRSQNEGYMGESFEPIVAFGANGAMCHYEATVDDCSDIGTDNFLLFDTGGQYLTGTTDVTRTVSIGNISNDMKTKYTAVLKGHIRLAAVKFPYGTRGINLDVLARQALWELGLDFNHGTGHGVGYFLNVHEGPNRICYKGNDNVNIEEGMLTSNEPGYYEEGNFGIRLENLVLAKNVEKTEYGQFMEYETVTMAPFDLDATDVSMLNDEEKNWLNAYHAKVYENISPYLNDDENNWLKEATRKI